MALDETDSFRYEVDSMGRVDPPTEAGAEVHVSAAKNAKRGQNLEGGLLRTCGVSDGGAQVLMSALADRV